MASTKVGRNDPCPCGSGKKFKKCCLDRPAEGPEPVTGEVTGRRFPNLSPYVIAKIAEDPRSAGDDARLRRLIEQGSGWTIKKVASMTTEAIEEQLAAYGVRHSPDRFLRLAEGRTSAWTIAETWIDEDQVKCTGKAGGPEDFLGLAACELWKRLLPDGPSIEMLDDWMQAGYTLVERKRHTEACDIWWRTWSALRARVFTADMTTMSDADTAFTGTQSIFNWSQDLELELGNAALSDQRYAVIGRQFCLEWAAQFTGEEGRMQAGFGHSLARFLFRLGEPAEAEKLLHALIARWPDDPWCYIHLADAHSHLFRGEHLALDIDKARGLLRRALSLPNLRPHDRDALNDRLADLDKPHRGAESGSSP